MHVVDIGGLGMGPDGRQVFEEGLAIPLMPLAREGRMNEDLLRIVRANVREPLQVEGDIYALAACNDEGSRRLVEMMDEFGIANLDRLGDTIIETSRQATIEAIRALPKGNYRNSLTMDGYDKPLVLIAAEMTISDDGIHVDYAGTSPARAIGINVVLNYTTRLYRVRREMPGGAGGAEQCRLARSDHGQRAGRLRAQRQAAAAVAARHTVGQMLPDVVFGCLHQVDGRRRAGRRRLVAVEPADLSAAARWSTRSEEGDRRECAAEFSTVIFHCGGAGARPGKDGLERDRLSVRRAHDPGRSDRDRWRR